MRQARRRAWRGAEQLESRTLLAGDLVADWQASSLVGDLLDGAAIAQWVDITGGRVATGRGTPLFELSGMAGRPAIRFDATDGVDSLRLALNSPLVGATDFSLTVAFAAEVDSPIGEQAEWYRNTAIVDANTFGLFTDWGLTLNGAGQVSAGMGRGFGQPVSTLYSTEAGLDDNQVHIVTLTRQQGTLRLFVDGNPPQTLTGADPAARQSAGLSIGELLSNGNGFSGHIGQVRVYNGQLSSPEVTSLHQEIHDYYFAGLPETLPDYYTLEEDPVGGSFRVASAAGVLANDREPNGVPLIATLAASPEHGELVLESDGSFSYVPEPNYFGVDQFAYIATGGRVAPPTFVTLDVVNVDDAPLGQSDQFVTFVGEARSFDAAHGVLTNDVEVDNQPLTARLISASNDVQVTLRADGSLDLVPRAQFSGLATFTYVVSDGVNESSPVRVDVQVLQDDQRVVINEIHYDPPENTIPEEFIELFNQGASPVDLSNWFITGGISYVFPADTVIQPGQYLVVAQDPLTMQERFTVTESLGPWLGRLSSDGEDIVLHAATGETMDRVDYRQGFPWPIAAGGDGPSMELINPTLENDLGGSWRSGTAPTPGAVNSAFALNAPPQSRQVGHSPQQPKSGEATTVAVHVTDPNGVGNVSLSYQLVLPGNYIPALLPITPTSDLWRNRKAVREPNPAYEDPANWTTIAMRDDGVAPDKTSNDGIYTATIPAQPHRTLVRYRINVEDTLTAGVTIPYADDMSRNFAYFVYDGVPDYNGTSSEVLQSLPVYHLIARNEDVSSAVAFSPADQIPQGTLARFSYNWPAAFVYNGEVYDNISFRLRGANGRYYLNGKRSMRFRFNDGSYMQAYNQDGEPFPFKWRTLTTGKGFDNRQTQTYSLNEAVSMYLYDTIGLPAADTFYVHFRVIDDAAEAPDPWNGDFWGLNFVSETYDVRFLDAHDLPRGNLYKLINQTTSPLQQQRYQAPNATTGGADINNIERNLTGRSTPEFIEAHVNLEKYYLFHGLAEAIRHYDYWPSANKNMVYYFEPDYLPENTDFGKLWILPWDTDASWGPTWNNGHDVVYNALFPSSDTGGDSNSNPVFWPDYFNVIREIRDLLWQPDQLNPLIDEFAATILPLQKADADRWRGAPKNAGNYSGLTGPGTTSIEAFVQDMKDFAFKGGNWPGGSVPAGGRAKFLDTLQGSRGEAAELPVTPSIRYDGAASFAANELSFATGDFHDPQGDDSFGAMEWRIAEITDPAAPAYDPQAHVKMEYVANWESGELTEFSHGIQVPSIAVEPGHTYRARVRMQDNTGRWSHWSEPIQFTATAATGSDLVDSLRISEINYHPGAPTQAEVAAGFDSADDFEFLELVNAGTHTISLAGAQLAQLTIDGSVQGVAFDFANGAVPTLAPGEHVLVVEDSAAFAFRYGDGHPVAGQWTGGLSNNSETLQLLGDGLVIHQFAYHDDWYPATDGMGASLELISAANRDLNSWGTADTWRASTQVGGTPGNKLPVVGDSNHDGIFSSSDLVLVFQAGEYEDGIPQNSTFEEGDWNGDGEFTTQDLVFAFQVSSYVAAARP